MDVNTSVILLLMIVGFWMFVWGALGTMKAVTTNVDTEDSYKSFCQVIAIFIVTFLGIAGAVVGAYLFISNLLKLL